jgi:clan AA aspartic protease
MTVKDSPLPNIRTTLSSGDEPMGEVRVKAKLTNVVDAALARHGKIPAADIRTYEADALVDTGAIRTVIPQFVAKQLGVDLPEERVAEYADGRKEVVPLTDAVRIEIMGRNTIEACLVLGDEVLIGQTVLETTDLFVDCAGQRLVPNPAHPDQPVTKVK